MKKILLLLAIIFSFLMLRAQLPGNWYQQPDFPGVERYAAQGLTINGKGYMVAGDITCTRCMAKFSVSS
jgi:hypothetical protein